ncbi:MAG TPA: CaiB/BaiF CoA-transferase family protein [Candidatus Acidoferrales bacterium]|nr:CaiB/BaiF CoA-transferase family protein [Candidatus Acidoferrales bacterium]
MKPLSHIRVLELGQVIAGTFAGMMLADLGAEVIKIEPPHGDLGRNPHIGYLRGESAIFLTFNRGKKSTVMNLKHPRGLAAFHDLVKVSDVVIDNFRPGATARIGADYETLSALNPGIVCCSVTGFGDTGPRRDMPSFDLIHQSLSGLLKVTGERGGEPARIGIPLADIGTPMFALSGLLAALVARQVTGRGQKVEVSMLESMTFLNTYDAVLYLNTGAVPEAWGTSHAYHVPWQAFATSDGHVVVATREEAFWRRYCEAIGMPELAEDPRYAENLARLEHRDELVAILEARMRERSSGEWMEVFLRLGVPSAPVNDLAQALLEPTIADTGAIVEVPYAPLGTLRMMANPLRLSEDDRTYSGPPILGEHTRQVLAEVAGYKADTIADLEREGAVGLLPPPGEGAG